MRESPIQINGEFSSQRARNAENVSTYCLWYFGRCSLVRDVEAGSQNAWANTAYPLICKPLRDGTSGLNNYVLLMQITRRKSNVTVCLITLILGYNQHTGRSILYLNAIMHMMTSWNESIFSVTGPLWGNPPVTVGFPSQMPVTRSYDVLIFAWTNGWANKLEAGDSRRHRAHDNVSVMQIGQSSHDDKYHAIDDLNFDR